MIKTRGLIIISLIIVLLVLVGCTQYIPREAPPANIPTEEQATAQADQSTGEGNWETICTQMPNVLKRHCSVTNDLKEGGSAPITWSKCSTLIQDPYATEPALVLLYAQPWTLTVRQEWARERPSWDVEGVGDSAWVHAFSSDVTQEQLESKGYMFNVKKGGTLYSFEVIGKDAEVQTTLQLTNSCSPDAFKMAVKELLGED